MTLAVHGTTAWVACKEQARVTRVDLTKRRTTASVRVGSPVIAVVYAFSSVWTVDATSTVIRIAPSSGRITKRIRLNARAAYNIWSGGGSIWVADDQGASVIRVSPKTNRVVARIPVSDGPADMAFARSSGWVIDHRDAQLYRIDLGTNRSTLVAKIAGDAPERMVYLSGSLWITGRGTDLLRVDPATGEVRSTIDIGASGIDVAATAGTLWVPSRSAAVDPTGFPSMEALRRVSASTGEVTTVATASGRLDVNGIDARDGYVWLSDNREGVLYRVKA
jgi:streptogramin lyase